MKTQITKGQPNYTGASEETEFSADLFHEVNTQYGDQYQWALHTDIGSLTVVDRMTGFSGGMRDIETGFRGPKGDQFWLASGGADVRKSGAKTLGEAIQWVKDESNIFGGGMV